MAQQTGFYGFTETQKSRTLFLFLAFQFAIQIYGFAVLLAISIVTSPLPPIGKFLYAWQMWLNSTIEIANPFLEKIQRSLIEVKPIELGSNRPTLPPVGVLKLLRESHICQLHAETTSQFAPGKNCITADDLLNEMAIVAEAAAAGQVNSTENVTLLSMSSYPDVRPRPRIRDAIAGKLPIPKIWVQPASDPHLNGTFNSLPAIGDPYIAIAALLLEPRGARCSNSGYGLSGIERRSYET
jgi:hypothetical protein